MVEWKMGKLSLILLFLVMWAPSAAQAQRTDKVDTELVLARQITADQALFFALARNDVQSMVALRNQGANPNASLSILGLTAKDVFGGESPLLDQPFDPASWPILHWAVFLNNIDAVKLLLRGGAQINAVDIYGGTALHWAAWGGRHSIAKLLLNNGANCLAADIKRRTPREWAIMSSQSDILTLLGARACRPGAYDDRDGDGVPDHQDLCPNTPLGAQVDQRGCWVVAYANFFDFDKAIVKSQYLPHLANAAEVLKNNPGLKLDIQGHTDHIGTEEYNSKLGLRRAEAVKSVLVGYGVGAERLSLSSFGECQPMADNRSAHGRSLNRRVEIHVREPGEQVNVSVVRPATVTPVPASPAAPPLPPSSQPQANQPVVRN
jgi:flagellar motor protein MotB